MKVIPAAETSLGEQGFPGKLGLLKNCRDAQGHVYGAQESFQVSVASGFSLLGLPFRIGRPCCRSSRSRLRSAGWLFSSRW